MVDYQRLIDTIRGLLTSRGVSSEALATAAADYVAACSDVNDRLRRCGELLRQGLRSEAIQLCEVEPNLLNLVATLDFPDLPEWQELLRSQQIILPEPLLIEVAADLNEAYAQEQPVAALLKRHRLLALARSPLRERLATLKKLSRLDPTNPVWQDDVRVYERARHQEIQRSTEQESKRGDALALEEMVQDLQCNDWLETPPAPLVSYVTKTYTKLRREQALAELNSLEPKLNEAFAQLDVEAARALRDRWRTAMATAALTNDNALVERAAPALEWLELQDREDADTAGFASAVVALETALDDELGAAKLERLAHAALRFDRPLPALLEQRFRARIASLELTKTRRLRIAVGAVLLALLAVSGAIGLAIYRHGREAAVVANVGTLRQLLDQQLVDEAEKQLGLLAQTDPGIVSDSRIQSLKVEIANHRRDENKRQSEFSAAIDRAEAAGTSNPDRSAIELASNLAATEAEKTRVLRLQSAVGEIDRQQQGKHDEEFLRRLAQLRTRLSLLNDNARDADIGSLQDAFASLVDEGQQASQAVRDQIKPLQARLNAIQNARKLRQEMDVRLNSLTKAVARIDAYKTALENFSSEFRNSARANIFKRVSLEADLWRHVERWNDFVDRWSTAEVSRLEAQGARNLLTECNEILSEYPDYPLAIELRKRMRHLEAINHRVSESGEKLYSSLSELFTDPLVVDLWMVEDVDPNGNRSAYYFVDRPPAPKEGNNSRFPYILDFNRKAATRGTRLNKITYNGLAPQSLVQVSHISEHSFFM